MTDPSYEAARLELARLRVDSREAYDQAVVRTTELSARTLGVERVGVWLFDPADPGVLRLEHLYVASTNTHTEGQVLVMDSASRYREALHTRKAIVADDARTDPVTCGLRAGYLEPNGIASMLDAPLYTHGHVVGVICHEHVGPPRKWTAQEIDFACTIADTASLICEQAQRLAVERELRERVASASASEGMETVTLLARSLAHELGNVFTATRLGTDQLARTGTGAAKELATAIGEALVVGERLATDLRRFADRVVSQPPASRSPVSVVLARFAPILELLARSHARLVIDVDPTLSLAMDDTALEQIVLNLVLNARDAFVASGRTGTIKIEARRSASGAVLSISDDGPGFSPEVRAQLGHEYFTTKRHGTGLGLSVARKLAAAANGRLEIPVTDRGARLELHLPCA
jgi:two-component system cell cycle sensor histidine kinase/response regulator CckA